MKRTKHANTSPQNKPRFRPAGRYDFEDEHEAIQEFFSNYTLEEVRQLLYDMFRCWMVSKESAQLDRHGRDRVIFFYEQLIIILEASLSLRQKRIKKGTKHHAVIDKYKSVNSSPKNKQGFRLAGRYNFEDEHEAIQQFFSFYTLEEARRLRYNLFRCWMVSDWPTHLDSRGRDGVLFFCEQLDVILEASFRLQRERIAKGAKRHYVFA
jgi:hypothetical protein